MHRVADEAVQWWLPRHDPSLAGARPGLSWDTNEGASGSIAAGDAPPTTPGLPHPICTSCWPQANCEPCICCGLRPSHRCQECSWPVRQLNLGHVPHPVLLAFRCGPPAFPAVWADIRGGTDALVLSQMHPYAALRISCSVAEQQLFIASHRTQIVMRDRVTGEARGFGFVTVESAAADTVERTDHIIGGRKARYPPCYASSAVLRCCTARYDQSKVPARRPCPCCAD